MKRVCLFFTCLAVFAMAAQAEVIVFQDGLPNEFYTNEGTNLPVNQHGYQGTEDTYVSAYGSSRYYNMGQSQYFTAGNPNSYPTQHALLKFDLSCLSAIGGITITGATLDMASRTCGYADQEVVIHELYPADGGWLEGAQAGAPGQVGDCTWNHREVTSTTGTGQGGRDGIPWEGGYGPANWTKPAYTPPYKDYDYDTILATFMSTNNDGYGPGGTGYKATYTSYSTALPASIVQSWIAPVKDVSGLIFRATMMREFDPDVDPWHEPYESPSMINFLSSDYAMQYHVYWGRPKLTIEYIPEPMTMVLLGLGGLLIRRKK
jgi:hypothetical protein